MGNTESSPQHVDNRERTVGAYTFRGFGCARWCAGAAFQAGAPAPSVCGATCGSEQFEDGAIVYGPFRDELEADLGAAAEIATNETTWCSYIACSGCDSTAEAAARRLNESWCSKWNQGRLAGSGVQVQATSEVYGFGRSRATFLVLRVLRNSD